MKNLPLLLLSCMGLIGCLKPFPQGAADAAPPDAVGGPTGMADAATDAAGPFAEAAANVPDAASTDTTAPPTRVDGPPPSAAPDAAAQPPDGRPGTGRWSQIALPKIAPFLDRTIEVFPEDNNITALWFDSPSHGYVGTRFAVPNGLYIPGLLWGVNGAQPPKLIIYADGGGLEALFFVGFSRTSAGLIARTQVIGSVFQRQGETDAFAAVSSVGTGLPANDNSLTLEGPTTTNWWTGTPSGVFTAAQAPGPATRWLEVTPPAASCQPPIINNYHRLKFSVGYIWHPLAVSSDASTIMYVVSDGVCVSRDSGGSWTRSTIEFDDPNHPPTTGVLLLDSQRAVAWAYETGVAAFMGIYTTGNAGRNWRRAVLPANAYDGNQEIMDVVFAPSGNVGWVIGATDRETDTADRSPVLLWKTIDGGQTWVDIAAASFKDSPIAAADAPLLSVGFALDDDHLWIGGRLGTVLHHDRGGGPPER
jgi:hypothetical protein